MRHGFLSLPEGFLSIVDSFRHGYGPDWNHDLD
jgi:hypothetical protein